MARFISLHHLAESDHPLLEEGLLSIFNDPRVERTSSVTFTSDLDGVCLISRSLDAFKVCSFGETRVYTDPVVSDHCIYIAKSQFFNFNIYDNIHRKHAKFIPGFVLQDVAGAELKVIGILDKDADVDDLVNEQRGLATFYFKNILKEAIKSLPVQSRTRKSNILLNNSLPRCFKIYPEDVPQLSIEIKRLSITPRSSYRFYFAYYKFGQQHIIPHGRPTLSNCRLDLVVDKPSKILCASLHFAVNFVHINSEYSLFWSRVDTAQYATGRDTKKYPFMGLSEIGNITSVFPHHLSSLLAAWPGSTRAGINLTYVQAYTPFVKPLDALAPFQSHPFLLTLMLGRDYVKNNNNFGNLVERTEGLADYKALKEAVILQLSRATARFEVAVTSSSLRDALDCNIPVLARQVVGNSLLIKIPRDDIPRYALSLLKELVQPLQAALAGSLDGPGQLSTVLLCETILSLLPKMSLKDMPYQLLREYNITPIEGGVMGSRRHLSLSGQATLLGGLLYVPRMRVQRIFVHLRELPGQARRQALRMLDFLDKMKTNDRTVIAEKAAATILSEFVDELVKSDVIAKASMLKIPTTLAARGGCVFSTIQSEEYCRVVFDPTHLPRVNRLRAFLKLSLDLVSEEVLYPAIANILGQEYIFVPKAVIHEGSVSFSSTHFQVLTRSSFSSLVSLRRPLQERECVPLLKATQSILMRILSLKPSTCREITRYSLRNAAVISFVLRHKRFPTQKAAFAVIGWALLELGKVRGKIGRSLSARPLVRACNLDRHISARTIRAIVERSNAGDTSCITRPFSINITRII